MKNCRLFLPSLVCFSVAACGGGSTPSPGPVRSTVAGRVTNRIDGVPLAASRISFRGITGLETGRSTTANVTAGGYELRNLPSGAYEVTIEDAAHLTHKTSRVNIPEDGLDLPFSVIGWNSGAFGARYDATFDTFYRAIRGQSVIKWSRPPSQIYVEVEGIDSSTLARVLGWLHEINDETLPAMFCGLTGPLPIEAGPALPNHRRDGAIVIWFGSQPFNSASRPTMTGPVPGTLVYAASSIHLIAENYMRNTEGAGGRCVMTHELFHAAYANHAPVYQDTMMRENCLLLPRTLSAEDRLASCLVYHPDTRPGNQLPDTNSTYR